MRSRAIYGLAGTALSAEETSFFRDTQPWGFILFARNIETPDQVWALVSSLRDFMCMLAFAKLAVFDPRFVRVREEAYA